MPHTKLLSMPTTKTTIRRRYRCESSFQHNTAAWKAVEKRLCLYKRLFYLDRQFIVTLIDLRDASCNCSSWKTIANVYTQINARSIREPNRLLTYTVIQYIV